MTALERAARALARNAERRAWGRDFGGYELTFAGHLVDDSTLLIDARVEETWPLYVDDARAVLMAVRDFDGDVYVGPNLIEDHECGPIFASVIDAILNEKDTTND